MIAVVPTLLAVARCLSADPRLFKQPDIQLSMVYDGWATSNITAQVAGILLSECLGFEVVVEKRAALPIGERNSPIISALYDDEDATGTPVLQVMLLLWRFQRSVAAPRQQQQQRAAPSPVCASQRRARRAGARGSCRHG